MCVFPYLLLVCFGEVAESGTGDHKRVSRNPIEPLLLGRVFSLAFAGIAGRGGGTLARRFVGGRREHLHLHTRVHEGVNN